jgi:protein TonB
MMTGRVGSGTGAVHLLPRREAAPADNFHGGNGLARADGLLSFAPGASEGTVNEAALPPEADISNVVVFAPRRAGPRTEAPDLSVTNDDRPAAQAVATGNWKLASFVAGSLLLHAGLLVIFGREPPPMASVGIEMISVELVLGADKAAGTSRTDGENPVESALSRERVAPEKPPDKVQELASVMPREVPVTEHEVAPTLPAERTQPKDAPQEVKTEAAEIAPPQTQATPVTPAEKPAVKQEQAVPPAVQQQAPAPKRVAAPQAKQPAVKKKSVESPNARAAPSIGRGRSELTSNYRGIVAAHLARQKQYPSDARRNSEQGVAAVTFTIGGNGAVTSVRLASSSGHPSLDREVQAMVRRASPFPPPPGGQSMSFTVPISFRLN